MLRKTPSAKKQTKNFCLCRSEAGCVQQFFHYCAALINTFARLVVDLPMLLRELPLDGEIWRRRGSMKGVKEEEDLCLDMELLSDWD